MQTALLFSALQVSLIVIAAIVFALLIGANAALLVLFFRKRKKSKLCTEALQRRREELLEELAQLRYYAPKPKAEEPEEEEEESEEAEDFESEDDFEPLPIEGTSDGEQEQSAYGNILAVRDMSPLMREKLGFVGAKYDLNRYYVRYTYSFEAKLCASDDAVKGFYRTVADELAALGYKSRRSFRGERIYMGRKTLGVLLFRGKTLCITLALSPAEYAETKYRGRDVSHVKRFAATPMLVKITSQRRTEAVKYLLAELARANGLARNPRAEAGYYNLRRRGLKALYAAELVKITVLGEAEPLEESALTDAGRGLRVLAVSDMSPLMREKFSLTGTEFDGKRYYVRYSYGFEARLRSSQPEVKERYTELMEEIGRYVNMKVAVGFRGQRLCYGRKTLGVVHFKGKTLCVALALDPKKYEESKYKGIDVSGIKRFEKTPMLMKITSARRLLYVKYLLNVLAEQHSVALRDEPKKLDYALNELSLPEYFEKGMLKITVAGEVPSGQMQDK